MLRMGKKVWIISERKTDGRYNSGTIVGIDMRYGKLGFMTEKQYIRDHELYAYKVAYVDVVTGKGESKWYSIGEVSGSKPKAVDN